MTQSEAAYKLLERSETLEIVRVHLIENGHQGLWLKIANRARLAGADIAMLQPAFDKSILFHEQKAADAQRQAGLMREVYSLLLKVPGFRGGGLTTGQAIERLSTEDRAQAESLLAQLPAMMPVTR